MSNLFISYSHRDENVVDELEKHFTLLKNEGSLSTWYDNKILPGTNIDKAVFDQLEKSDIFLAILSPDYIASYYCYEREFKRALEKTEAGGFTIIPVIADHCDWKSSPFGQFKALPKDGKAITTWLNPNAAYLNVTEELRRLLKELNNAASKKETGVRPAVTSRNYKIKQDFTAVDVLNFKEETFKQVLNYFQTAIAEVDSLDDIQARFTHQDKSSFSAIIANRKKANTSGYIAVSIQQNTRQSWGKW